MTMWAAAAIKTLASSNEVNSVRPEHLSHQAWIKFLRRRINSRLSVSTVILSFDLFTTRLSQFWGSVEYNAQAFPL